MNNDISNTISAGLRTLSSRDIRVPSDDIEVLANFKEILRAILGGKLVLATPDRVLPEGVKLPNQETKTPIKEA